MAATMLGQGLYDAAEVAWLLGHDPEWVVRWSTKSTVGPAIVEPAFGRMFSFADFSIFVVGVRSVRFVGGFAQARSASAERFASIMGADP